MRRSTQILTLAWALAGTVARADELVAPYVPTPEEDVELMLEVGGVGPGDYVVDLGSGDGRIVISAAKRGANGHGIELQQSLVDEAAANAREAGVGAQVAFVQGDVFEADIAAASVVTLYLFPEANIMLRPKLLTELRPGTRVVSNSFHMGDWAPDVHDMSARSSGGILLWIIPARIGGEWMIDVGDSRWTMNASQQYQQIDLDGSGSGFEITDATLHGDRIAFSASGAGGARFRFAGRVDGERMEGYAQIERPDGTRINPWVARRTLRAAPGPEYR